MPAEPLEQLAQAIEATGRVIDSVAPAQWGAPSPCSDWDVAGVARHLIGGNFGFASIADGKERPPLADLAPADTDLAGAFRASGAALIEAYGQPGALERVVVVPIGPLPGVAAVHLRVVEILVHGWDIATATAQALEIPEDLVEQELAFTRSKLSDIPAGHRPFAPARPVAPDAPALDQLVACLGRDVASHGS
jgi:uncharacterized protein (TIGR03086 family)